MSRARSPQAMLILAVVCSLLGVANFATASPEDCSGNVVYGYDSDTGNAGDIYWGVDSPTQCMEKCIDDPNCYYYVWNGATKQCFLKSAELVREALLQSTELNSKINTEFCPEDMVERCDREVNCLRCLGHLRTCAFRARSNVVAGPRSCIITPNFQYDPCNPNGLFTPSEPVVPTSSIPTTTTKPIVSEPDRGTESSHTATEAAPEVEGGNVSEPVVEEGGVGVGAIAGATAGGLAAVGAAAWAVQHFVRSGSSVLGSSSLAPAPSHQTVAGVPTEIETSVGVDEAVWV